MVIFMAKLNRSCIKNFLIRWCVLGSESCHNSNMPMRGNLSGGSREHTHRGGGGGGGGGEDCQAISSS